MLELASAAERTPPPIERMTKIIEIDEGNLMAVVEPGVLIMDTPAQKRRRRVSYLPLTPRVKSRAVSVGTSPPTLSGVGGWKSRVTGDSSRDLEVVLPSGEVITIGGRRVKNSTGYELIDLFVGLEKRILGVVSKATLRLVTEAEEHRHHLRPLPGS